MSNIEREDFLERVFWRAGNLGKKVPGEMPRDIRKRGIERVGAFIGGLIIATSGFMYGNYISEMNEKHQTEFEQQVDDCVDQLANDGAPEFMPIPVEDAPVISGSPVVKADHETYCEQKVVDSLLQKEQY